LRAIVGVRRWRRLPRLRIQQDQFAQNIRKRICDQAWSAGAAQSPIITLRFRVHSDRGLRLRAAWVGYLDRGANQCVTIVCTL
jgi:hypothetical protein